MADPVLDSREGAGESAASRAPQTCLEAAVSPVSGFAECINPRGAPVQPAPHRPDAPCPSNGSHCADSSAGEHDAQH